MTVLMIVPLFGFELPAAVRERLRLQGVSDEGYDRWLRQLRRKTAERERNGELDHLIHYALLSRRFTTLPPMEPALSAKAFVETGTIPKRIDAFRAALSGGGGGERMEAFRKIAAGADLDAEYRRAMRFLYAKEFGGNRSYTSRGHSTDTNFSANYAVWQGLAVLKQMNPRAALERVLIIGPGLDFAPRTALNEDFPPQSYQPFAVLDALPKAYIHCYDINDRVIRFFTSFSRNPVLQIDPGPGDEQYQRYFQAVGRHIGSVQPHKIVVSPQFASRVTAEKHDIVLDPPRNTFDLVIATNVLLYYDGPELTLALANIAAHMRKGSFFLHNDLRPEMDEACQAAGLEAMAARTVRISGSTYDSFALYRR